MLVLPLLVAFSSIVSHLLGILNLWTHIIHSSYEYKFQVGIYYMDTFIQFYSIPSHVWYRIILLISVPY